MTRKTAAQEKPIKPLVLPDDLEELKALAQAQYAKITEVTKQRDNLRKLAQDLGDDLETLRTRDEIQHEIDMRHARIRAEWWATNEEFCKAVRKLFARLPLATSTTLFDADDWNLLAETRALTQRFLAELDKLQGHQFIEAQVSIDAEPT